MYHRSRRPFTPIPPTKNSLNGFGPSPAENLIACHPGVFMESKAHWEKLWNKKRPDEVSWFEPEPST